jgi:hypothetical protein
MGGRGERKEEHKADRRGERVEGESGGKRREAEGNASRITSTQNTVCSMKLQR